MAGSEHGSEELGDARDVAGKSGLKWSSATPPPAAINVCMYTARELEIQRVRGTKALALPYQFVRIVSVVYGRIW
eukprot:1925801-Prymnesium_polylepis.1